MFSKNLKYYRLKHNLSKKALAEKAGITAMAVSYYEKGERRPEMATIKKLAEALNIMVTDFLAVRNENLVFAHEEFRKNSGLGKHQQEFVREAVEEYFSRFFETVEILGGEILPRYPETHCLIPENSIEKNAQALRNYLGISESGPVGNLMELLENRGMLICLLDIELKGFSGINGSINGRPYIAISKRMSPERIRTTIGHELVHMAFEWPDDMNEKDSETLATKISGAFLFPENDAKRELGLRRTSVTSDMYLVCKEYGIAMSLLVMRAHACEIIRDNTVRNYFIMLNKTCGKENEKSLIQAEEALLFPQLVYRAVTENEISIQKGAELLRMPYDDVAVNCCKIGENV